MGTQVTIMVDETLKEGFEQWCKDHTYSTVSEAIRDFMRKSVEKDKSE